MLHGLYEETSVLRFGELRIDEKVDVLKKGLGQPRRLSFGQSRAHL